MPYALHVYVVPPGGGKVNVEHVFYGHSEDEADQLFETHADGCEFLGPAIAAGRVIEIVEEIESSEWPDKESLDAEAAPDPDAEEDEAGEQESGRDDPEED